LGGLDATLSLKGQRREHPRCRPCCHVASATVVGYGGELVFSPSLPRIECHATPDAVADVAAATGAGVRGRGLGFWVWVFGSGV
jgi:hypothetical protein